MTGYVGLIKMNMLMSKYIVSANKNYHNCIQDDNTFRMLDFHPPAQNYIKTFEKKRYLPYTHRVQIIDAGSIKRG